MKIISKIKLSLRNISFFLLCLWSTQITLAVADTVPIQGSVTMLESDAERMISYRHEEHMWQTSDGATHVLINRGSLFLSTASLQLYSSFDNGNSWIVTSYLNNTDASSTADGVLMDNNLGLVYSTADGSILYTSLTYDSLLQSWSFNKTEVVFASDKFTALNPAITIDAKKTIWCAFVNINNINQDANIKLSQRQLGKTWKDTGLIFGVTDNFTKYGGRSTRPVITSNGVGMVYTVHENMFWAYRINTWPLTTPWVTQPLYTNTLPYDTDPYNSHFSIAADSAKNLHMATVDNGELKYLRFINKTQTWDPVRTLSKDVSATYPQVTVADTMTERNTLAIFVNSFAAVTVLQSKDAGNTFVLTNTLTHDLSSDSNMDYTNPRIETPGKSTNPIPVFQQFVDGSIQRLMYFEVPAIIPTKATSTTDP